MPTYRLLTHPSVNRVYAAAAPELMVAELRALSALALQDRLHDVRVVEVAGAPYLQWETEAPLDEFARRVVGSSSGAYVLFEARDDLLAPIEARRRACYPDDLLSTLKYAGKTNEQFTALLVNLALAASARGFAALAGGERVRLLDPLCGRGTTLNQALMYGLDAAGVDTATKDLEIYVGFARQWLRDHRVKHRSEGVKVRKGRERAAKRHTITITHRAADDERRDPRLDPPPPEQVLDIINDDTTFVRDHLKGSSVDVVVGDLPYGIQHGSEAGHGRERTPEALLDAALPVWRGVLRGGGALCLAWNCRTLPRAEVESRVGDAGYRLVPLPEGVSFEHRVDRTITRDLVLATKPG